MRTARDEFGPLFSRLDCVRAAGPHTVHATQSRTMRQAPRSPQEPPRCAQGAPISARNFRLPAGRQVDARGHWGDQLDERVSAASTLSLQVAASWQAGGQAARGARAPLPAGGVLLLICSPECARLPSGRQAAAPAVESASSGPLASSNLCPTVSPTWPPEVPPNPQD